jgi:hypothetical protein
MTKALAVPRALALIALALMLTIVGAVPAQAHTSKWQFHTRLLSVQPALRGVTVKVGDDGEWLTLTNTSAAAVVVFGYEKEPYLRVGPDGVWQNTLSPSTYMNESLQIGAIPETVDTKAPPRWVRLNTSKSAAWHDHRVHWMGAELPPVVQENPGAPHVVNTWTVAAMQGSKPITITGTLSWSPVSSVFYTLTLPVMGALVIGVSAIFLLQVIRQRPRRGSASGQGLSRRSVAV